MPGPQEAGCFHWVVTIKRSLNRRWAKFRNRFIGRFRKNHPSASTCDFVPDAGAPDLVFLRKPVAKESERAREKTAATTDADAFEKQLDELSSQYAENAIKSALKQLDECAIDDFASQFSTTALNNAIRHLEKEARQKSCKSDSLTSDMVEDMAETAVRTSLTNIVADWNESCKRRPKTVGEYLETLGIQPFPSKDGMPRVDI